MSNRIGYNNIPQNGLVLDMPLDGNANARVGSNGTATNVTWVKSDKGYTSKAGSFNGSNSYIYTTGPDFFGTQPFTFSVYTKLNTLATVNYNSIIGINDGSVDAGVYDKAIQVLPTGQVRFYVSDTGVAKYIYGPSNITIGKYYHLLLSYNGSQATLYINGTPGTPVIINSTYNHTTPLVTFSNTIGILPRVNGTIQLVKIYNRALSQEEIHNLYLEGQRLFNTKPAYPQLLSGLVGYWDFKNGNLNNLVDGTLATNSGATLTTDHLGRANNAFSFNGSSSYIQTGTSSIFVVSGTTNIQYNVIFKLISLPTVSANRFNVLAITEIAQPLTYDKAIRIYGDGSIRFYGYDGVVKEVNSGPGVISTGIWYNIVGSYDGVNLKIYVNGILKGTTACSSTFAEVNPILSIGHNSTNVNDEAFNGTISQAILQNRALTAPEITQLNNLTNKEYIYPFPRQTTLGLTKGLVMHLDKNGKDLSGNGNNGTLTAVTPTKIGQIDGGIYNGSSSQIVIPSSVDFDFTTEYYIDTPINITSLPTVGNLYTIYYRENTAGTGAQLEFVLYNNGGIQQIFVSQATTFNPINYTLPVLQNIQLSVSYKNNIITFYLDGVIIGTISQTTQPGASTKTIAIGYNNAVVNRYFNGTIYEPKIWNRALTAKEVEQEYYNTKGNFIY